MSNDGRTFVKWMALITVAIVLAFAFWPEPEFTGRATIGCCYASIGG